MKKVILAYEVVFENGERKIDLGWRNCGGLNILQPNVETNLRNIEILRRFQNKVLRTSVNAPWYIPNSLLYTDLQMSTVRDEIMKYSTNYRAKLVTHPNELTSILLVEPGPRRF
jgi:hypothetical protein